MNTQTIDAAARNQAFLATRPAAMDTRHHHILSFFVQGGKQAIVNGTPHVADSDFIEVIGRAEADGSISYVSRQSCRDVVIAAINAA